jgi:hypothetical protein
MVERLQGLLGNFGSSLNNMSLPASLGLLSSGVSILEGNPIGQSINTGLQTFGGLTQIDQQRRQREGIEALKKQYANNPKILSLIDANPTAALNALTTQALTPRTPQSSVGKILADLKKGIITQEVADAAINKLTSTTGTTPNMQKGGSFKMEDGSVKNLFFDPSPVTGGYFEVVNGERRSVDVSKALPITEGFFTRTVPTFNDFSKLRKEVKADETSLKKYTSYLKNIQKSPTGVNRLGSELSTFYKNLFGKTAEERGLTESEVALQLAKGQIQGLLGASRLETVGGGVMTEQDALRVLRVLGGDVNLLQNEQVVQEAISTLFRDKFKAYEDKRKIHNISVENAYKAFGKIEPLDIDSSLLTSSVASELGFERTTFPENLDSLTLQELTAIPTENLSIEELGKLRDAIRKKLE